MKTGKVIRNVVLWSIGAILGLTLLALVTLQVLLRPKVLTGIVNRVAAQYVEGDVNFSEVKAHVIKSFPYLHLEAENFSVTYPHSRYARFDSLNTERNRRFSLMRAGNERAGGEGRQIQWAENGQDTLASFSRLDVELNYMALLGGTWHVHNLTLTRPRIFAHYFDSTAANWDILPIGPKTEDSPKDSVSKALPPIKVRKVLLTDRPFIVYTNPEDTLHGLFTMRRLSLDGKLETENLQDTYAQLSADSLFISGRLPADTVALALERLRAGVRDSRVKLEVDARTHLRTENYGRLKVPIHLDADATLERPAPQEMGATFHELNLAVSALKLQAKGEVLYRANGNLDVDMTASAVDFPLGKTLREYEDNFPVLKNLQTNAVISLDALAKGTYGNGQVPLVNATLHKLIVDIYGARLNVTGEAKDLLGKDPAMAVNGRIRARADSLARAFTEGIDATGRIDATLNAKARLSQLNMVHIGAANINADLTATDLSVQMDTVRAMLPHLEVNLATKGNKIDKNIRQGARVLALKAKADTLDASLGEQMFIRGGDITLLLQNSADILKGGKKLTPLMGLIKLGSLRVRDAEGMSIGLRNNTETFRVSPATEARPSPHLQLTSKSGGLRARLGENMYALRNVNFDIGASKHQRKHIPRDSTRRRRRPGGPIKADDFSRADIRINLGDGLRKYVREWDIDGNLALEGGRVFMPAFPLKTRLSNVQGAFDNDTLDLRSITLQAGESDVSARAKLTGLRRALIGRGRGLLKLKADVQSNYLDANELMRAYAYYSTYKPAGTLEDDAIEENVAAAELPDSAGRKLIVIPGNLEVNFTLESTGIKYDSLLVNWAAMDIAMRKRTLQVTNAVAASNMGDIYFEGFYTTRSKQDIKAGFDLNLVNITAEKVITLFPAVDSIMPMLTSFAGDLDCELAATTDIDTLMNLVKPSVDGVMRISGKDLTLRDSKEFTKIAKMLMFRDKKKAHIDNMAVTGIVQNNVLEVFPFVLDVDRYQVAASGRQQLDNAFNYHISVIRSPLLVKFGLNAWGPDFDHIHYGLGKARYRNAHVPVYTKQLDTAQYSLISAIHNIFELGVEKAMEENRTGKYWTATEPSGKAPEGVSETSGSPDVAAAAKAGDITEEALQQKVQDLATLQENVAQHAATRREALKQDVLQLIHE